MQCEPDGPSALEEFHTWNPKLLRLDTRLPDMNGFDVCRRIHGEGRREPILMLITCDEETDKVLGLNLGVDDYMVKPYQLCKPISRVSALLRRAYGDLAAGILFHDSRVISIPTSVWQPGSCGGAVIQAAGAVPAKILDG